MKKLIITGMIAIAAGVSGFAQAEPMSRAVLSVHKSHLPAATAISRNVITIATGKYQPYHSRTSVNQAVDTEIAAFETVATPATRQRAVRSDRNI